MALDKKRQKVQGGKKDIAGAVAEASRAPSHGAQPATGQGRPPGEPKKGKYVHFTYPTLEEIKRYAGAKCGGNASAFIEMAVLEYVKNNPL